MKNSKNPNRYLPINKVFETTLKKVYKSTDYFSKKTTNSYVNEKVLDYYIKEKLINNSTIVSQTNGDKIYPLLELGSETDSFQLTSKIEKIAPINEIHTSSKVILSPENSDSDISTSQNMETDIKVFSSNEINCDEHSISSKNRLMLFDSLRSLNRTELSDLIQSLKATIASDFTEILPQNVLTQIFSNLPINDLKECMLVNTSYKNIIQKDEKLWAQVIKQENYFKDTLIPPSIFEFNSTYKKFKFLEQKFYNWRTKNEIPETKIVNAHDVDVITCIELTPHHVITAADDTLINIYNHTGDLLKTLRGHEGGVWALKYNTTTNQLITAGTDRTIRIWDLDTFLCTHVFLGHTSTVRCLDLTDIDNHGRVIISGSRDSNVLLWKLPKKIEYDDTSIYPLIENNSFYIGTLSGHRDSVRSMSVHKNILVTGSYDRTCRIWDLKKMSCIAVLKGHGNRVYAVCYDHVRQKVFSTSTDFRIFVWDLKLDSRYSYKDFENNHQLTYSRPSMILNGHAGLVGLLELKGDILCSAAADGSVKGWDANDHKVLFHYYHDGTVPSSSFWFDDNFLILGSESQFTICDLRTGEQLYSNLLSNADNVWGIRANGDCIYAAIVQDHCSKLAILDFTKKVSSNKYRYRDSDVNGGISVETEYMMERRGKSTLRLIQERKKDSRRNILNDISPPYLGSDVYSEIYVEPLPTGTVSESETDNSSQYDEFDN
ncbi:hypothetical protein QEN19_003866 [Hanseniaspora menglaensis]